MKIYFKIYGCAANKADAGVMRTLLKEHKIVDSADNAELVIVLSCGVKGSTENKVLTWIKGLKGKKVLVGGCLPKIIGKKMQRIFSEFSFIGPDQIADIAGIVAQIESGEQVVETSSKKCAHVVADVAGDTQAIVICTGCLGKCAYCATKNARGSLHSYTIDEIAASVKKAVENGAKKILLTAQDTGCYGFDINTNLAELLKKIVKIEGDFKIRVGMMNPNHAIRIADELIEVFQNPKILKFVHVPVQAGSNEVLENMNRQYTVEEFKNLVKKLRKGILRLNVSTDVICGFPGETDEQFEETVALVKRIKPEVLNISKFYPRPGTEALKMKLLHTSIAKARSKRLFDIFKSLRKT